MSARLIRLTALTGHKVRVYVYDTAEEMRQAGQRFNGNNQDGAIGITQTYARNNRTSLVIVRLCREHLGTRVVMHEIHHAATAIYGAALGNRISSEAHFNHYNEPAAHLFSELAGKLVDRLYALGYYN